MKVDVPELAKKTSYKNMKTHRAPTATPPIAQRRNQNASAYLQWSGKRIPCPLRCLAHSPHPIRGGLQTDIQAKLVFSAYFLPSYLPP